MKQLLSSLLLPFFLLSNLQAVSPETLEALEQGCRFAYYPTQGLFRATADFRMVILRNRDAVVVAADVKEVHITVREAESATVLATLHVSVKDTIGSSAETDLILAPGIYTVSYELIGVNEPVVITRELRRETFAWEGNQLGISDRVYPPFTPVKSADEGLVEMVDRRYKLNSLGLFESVESLGEELLVNPVRLHVEMMDGSRRELPVTPAEKVSGNDVEAIYKGTVDAGFAVFHTKAVVEFDGMVKVHWTIEPGAQPEQIKRMWLEMAMEPAHATLMHNVVDANRINHAGYVPAGDGVVWTSTQARRTRNWQNSFNPYLWIGGPARGLAWFAENDKDWWTLKGESSEPIQQIVRSPEALTLQVFFANTPTTISRTHHIVFGLQASPTKPYVAGWRAYDPVPPGMSGPVNAWGSFQCSEKGPYLDDWSIVDKIIEARETGEVDAEWFQTWEEKYNPPLVHGRVDWSDRTLSFAKRESKLPQDYPTMIYFEEMRASVFSQEWITFQDEWGTQPFTPRNWPSLDVMRRGFNNQGNASISFPRTYQDYALYYANEWLKRGVGLYWDNTYPQPNFDPLTGNAYLTEDGNIQPSITLFNQREYMKRIWNLLGEYRLKHKPGDRLLEWSIHTTNTSLLPLQTFATIQLDYEVHSTEVAPPDFVRAEMTGLQLGNMPHVLDKIQGDVNPHSLKLSKVHQKRIEWGMRRVHEIFVHHGYVSNLGPWEEVFRGFGYGTDLVEINRYFDDEPLLSADMADIKWIQLYDPTTQQHLVVLSSWREDGGRIDLPIETLQGAPFDVRDAETGVLLAENMQSFSADLHAPYGMRMLLLTPAKAEPQFNWELRNEEEIVAERKIPEEKVVKNTLPLSIPSNNFRRGIKEDSILFEDDFEKGISQNWSFVAPSATLVEEGEGSNITRFLRFTESRKKLIGPNGIPSSLDPVDTPWKNYALRYRFRVGPFSSDKNNAAANATFLQTTWLRAATPGEPSQSQGLFTQLWRKDLGWRFAGVFVSWHGKNIPFEEQGVNTRPPQGSIKKSVDDQWHELQVQVLKGRTVVSLDGKVIFDGIDTRISYGGFSIETNFDDRARPEYIDIDDIAVWSITSLYEEEGSPNQRPYRAVNVETAPVIDGRLDDAIWGQAVIADAVESDWISFGRLRKNEPLRFGRRAYLLYDDENLYLGLFAEADDPANLRIDAGQDIFSGDGVELHAKTREGHYLHLGISVNGSNNVGTLSNASGISRVQSASSFLDDGWSTEVVIPWEVLRGVKGPSDIAYFNLAANSAYQGNSEWLHTSARKGFFDLKKGGVPLILLEVDHRRVIPEMAVEEPVIDGKLDEKVWQRAGVLAKVTHFQTLEENGELRDRKLTFAYDQKHLYVALELDTSVYAEVIEDFVNGDTLQLDFIDYSLGVTLAEGTSLPILLPYRIPTTAAVQVVPERLTLEVAVPWGHIGGVPAPGEVRRFNVGGHESFSGEISWQTLQDLRDLDAFGELMIPEASED